MTEQTKNSAEASLELRAALHKLEQTMTSGVSEDSIHLAGRVLTRAEELYGVILGERIDQAKAEELAKKLRAAA
jgi:hypothetical protein